MFAKIKEAMKSVKTWAKKNWNSDSKVDNAKVILAGALVVTAIAAIGYWAFGASAAIMAADVAMADAAVATVEVVGLKALDVAAFTSLSLIAKVLVVLSVIGVVSSLLNGDFKSVISNTAVVVAILLTGTAWAFVVVAIIFGILYSNSADNTKFDVEFETKEEPEAAAA